MRTSMVLRTLVLAAALSAPLSQVALANQQEQQAMTTQSATAAPFFEVSPYSDSLLAPSVGD